MCSRALASNHLSLEVTNVADGFNLKYGVNPVSVNVSSQAGVEKVEYLLNDKVQYTSTAGDYSGNVRVPRVLPTGSRLDLKVRLVDVNGYMSGRWERRKHRAETHLFLAHPNVV